MLEAPLRIVRLANGSALLPDRIHPPPASRRPASYRGAGQHVPASCVLHVHAPEAQGSLPRAATAVTYGVHAPASGVPCVPRTVATQPQVADELETLVCAADHVLAAAEDAAPAMAVVQHGQSGVAPLGSTVPQLGACASSGRAWCPRAARHS